MKFESKLTLNVTFENDEKPLSAGDLMDAVYYFVATTKDNRKLTDYLNLKYGIKLSEVEVGWVEDHLGAYVYE